MSHLLRACLVVCLLSGCRDGASGGAQRELSSNVDDDSVADRDLTSQPGSSQGAPAEWAPARDQAPDEILVEAKQNVSDGKYEEALGKYSWLFRRHVDAGEAHLTTQLSPILRDWKLLGDVYPPAKAMIFEIRTEAESNVRSDSDAATSFIAFAAINSALNEEQETVNLFKQIDKNNVQTAGEAFEAAWPALMKHGELELCSTYVDPKDYQRFVESYQQSIASSDESIGESEVKLAKSQFSARVASLVALLVLSERKDEAETIVRDAVVLLPEKEFANELSRAMEGKVSQSNVNR